MKQSMKHFLGGMLLLAMPLMMTSCEGTLDDIFGEWSRPTNQQNNEPTKEELLSDLSSALEEGAIVTITYTIDGVEYTSTFKRVGDDYIEQSTTPAAGAMTRSDWILDDTYTIKGLGGTVEYNDYELHFTAEKNYDTQLDVSIEVANCAVTTNFATDGSELDVVQVNGKKANAIISNKSDTFTLYTRDSRKKVASYSFYPGETWLALYERIVSSININIQVIGDEVYFTSGEYTGKIRGQKSSYLIQSGKYHLIELYPVSYNELNWDETNKVTTVKAMSVKNPRLVTSSNRMYNWPSNTYVVLSDVTINGGVIIQGDVKLILCDGATLTINNLLGCNEQKTPHSLTIYSQGDTNPGKLVIHNAQGSGIKWLTNLTIHGGDINVESRDASSEFNLCMYGGKFSAKATGNAHAIKTGKDKNMTIYGGELEVENPTDVGILVGDYNNFGTLTVYGGSVKASAPKGQAIKGKFAKGEGTSVWFFESDDGVWSEPLGEDDHTSTAHYFKAEVVEEPAEASGTE